MLLMVPSYILGKSLYHRYFITRNMWQPSYQCTFVEAVSEKMEKTIFGDKNKVGKLGGELQVWRKGIGTCFTLIKPNGIFPCYQM